ncbi:MAG: Gfo/Idh/MocA family protein, partial [Acidimicrobiales bacterium]
MSVVRVGLIGYGYWGTNLARNVATTPMLRLAAVAEAEATCRARAIAEHPAVPVHDDPEALLARDDIDAVMLATPASTHGELGMEALRTGRHLFVEKPLALDRKTAGVLVDEAARRARVLMVGHTYL